jgi:hypothetical protein
MKEVVETPEWKEYIDKQLLTENVRYGEEFRDFLQKTQNAFAAILREVGRYQVALTAAAGMPACARGLPRFRVVSSCLSALYTYGPSRAELPVLGRPARSRVLPAHHRRAS